MVTWSFTRSLCVLQCSSDIRKSHIWEAQHPDFGRTSSEQWWNDGIWRTIWWINRVRNSQKYQVAVATPLAYHQGSQCAFSKGESTLGCCNRRYDLSLEAVSAMFGSSCPSNVSSLPMPLITLRLSFMTPYRPMQFWNMRLTGWFSLDLSWLNYQIYAFPSHTSSAQTNLPGSLSTGPLRAGGLLLLVGLTWLLANTLFGGESGSFLRSFFIGEKKSSFVPYFWTRLFYRQVVEYSSCAKCMLHIHVSILSVNFLENRSILSLMPLWNNWAKHSNDYFAGLCLWLSNRVFVNSLYITFLQTFLI